MERIVRDHMSFSPDAVIASLRARMPASASGELCVAFSGGLDSTVLLAVLARAVRGTSDLRVRAIHIDHQLQPQSGQWARHCGDIARELGVHFESHQVAVVLDPEEGLEASARLARYEALTALMRPSETLLMAHHSDDQLETMLLALMRGSGVRGLASMPDCQPLGPGWLVRPLLDWSREALEQWATQEGLRWVEDPTNDDHRFSRNLLRARILPVLRDRWPAAARNAARSAAHLAESAVLADELAALDHAAAAIDACLDVARLETLSAARRRNLLRFWIRQQGGRLPSTRKLLALEHDMLAAAPDRVPVVEWDGFAVRRFRGLLYADRSGEPQLCASLEWNRRDSIELPSGLGSLRIDTGGEVGLSLSSLPQVLKVDFRHGGELLRPAGHAHRHRLKELLRTADILPWWRSRLPLIWAGERLAAVGDLWIAEDFATRDPRDSVRIVWDSRPQITAAQR